MKTERKWYSDKLVIGGFIAPTPKLNDNDFDLIKEQVYKDVKACGLDFLISISYSKKDFPEQFDMQFDYCQRHGLKLIIIDENLYARFPEDKERFLISSKAYAQKQSFGGLLTCDEPKDELFEKIGDLGGYFKELYPDKLAFSNLFPVWAPARFLSDKENYSYLAYVDDYLKIVKPEVLSYDLYPFIGEFPYIREDYFENLLIIRQKAIEKGLPYWNFLQSTSYDKSVRYVTQDEMFFQVNTSLACGYSGLIYFTYAVPVSELPAGEAYESAIIEKNGDKTQRYYFAQKCNQHIKSVEKHLLNAKSKCVAFIGEKPKLSFGKAVDEIEGVSVKASHLVIGEFENQSQRVLYLVNNSISQQDSVEITFDDVCLVQSSINEFVSERLEKISFNLYPGRSVILKIEKGEQK